MLEEEDEEILSSSGCDDSSDSYKEDSEESEGEIENSEENDECIRHCGGFSFIHRKSKNVNDLLRDNLVVQRQPLLPRVLSVSEGTADCRKPFKSPCSHGYNSTGQLSRRLSARKRFFPWGSLNPVVVALPTKLEASTNTEKDEEEEVVWNLFVCHLILNP